MCSVHYQLCEIVIETYMADMYTCVQTLCDTSYDAVSANVMIWVLQMGESESGQMVSEKVKWA